MNAHDSQTDPVELLESISSREIMRRLNALAAQEDGLRVLLRAALKRERGQSKPRGRKAQAAPAGGRR